MARPGGADLSALAALGTAAAAILKLAPNFALAAPPVFVFLSLPCLFLSSVIFVVYFVFVVVIFHSQVCSPALAALATKA